MESDYTAPRAVRATRFGASAASGMMLAKFRGMTSSRVWRNGETYRAAAELAIEENSWEQARRRAARWRAWLTSPECTLQDRENFERWRSDETNAAAYEALCAGLAEPSLADASAFARAACAVAAAREHAPASSKTEIRLRADAP
jgi:hypothetical protein